MNVKNLIVSVLAVSAISITSCKDEIPGPPPIKPEEPVDSFYFGADLSYVNQLLDYNAVYKSGGQVTNPYKIFAGSGTNLVRLRLWHNPVWTKTIYEPDLNHMYNDLADVEKAIKAAKAEKMSVLLDFHYSDDWADPDGQPIPDAWKNIKTIAVLKDSVYNYTFKTLKYLDQKGLMPELVQLGNETNCGILYTSALSGFPSGYVCGSSSWTNFGEIIKSASKAVSDVRNTSSIKTKVILHVADPKNIDWWFTALSSKGGVASEYDMIGFSYYPLWHDESTTVTIDNLSDLVSSIKSKFKKDVILLETAYPWTTAFDDSNNNLFGNETPLTNYPFTQQGQYDLLVKLTVSVL
jgi:arabinogalactan endo-1,4-beta-galactosidase